jgi:hypothetical protein
MHCISSRVASAMFVYASSLSMHFSLHCFPWLPALSGSFRLKQPVCRSCSLCVRQPQVNVLAIAHWKRQTTSSSCGRLYYASAWLLLWISMIAVCFGSGQERNQQRSGTSFVAPTLEYLPALTACEWPLSGHCELRGTSHVRKETRFSQPCQQRRKTRQQKLRSAS